MYVVDSIFILLQYVNPVWTNYVVSEPENMVELLERIGLFEHEGTAGFNLNSKTVEIYHYHRLSN